MKLLAFTDLHTSISSYKKIQAKVKKHNPDFIVCTGDFTIFEQNLEPVLRKIAELGKPTFILHGNHETDTLVQKICKKHKNLIFAHKNILSFKNLKIIGHGGGGFYGQGRLAGEPEFDTFVKKHAKKLTGNLILLTHAPPAHTKLDYIDWLGDHVGCTSYKKFIEKHQPILALCGHIHETFGISQKIGKTLCINPGPEGVIIQL